MPSSFTLVLTKGAYVVREQDALAVLEAIDAKENHVLVEADLLGDGIHYTPVRIVTAHVIAVVSNDEMPRKAVGPRLSLA